MNVLRQHWRVSYVVGICIGAGVALAIVWKAACFPLPLAYTLSSACTGGIIGGLLSALGVHLASPKFDVAASVAAFRATLRGHAVPSSSCNQLKADRIAAPSFSASTDDVLCQYICPLILGLPDEPVKVAIINQQGQQKMHYFERHALLRWRDMLKAANPPQKFFGPLMASPCIVDAQARDAIALRLEELVGRFGERPDSGMPQAVVASTRA